MEPYHPTTPFGRRTLTLAYVASQAVAKACPPEKAAHKWNVFRDICAAKNRLAVSDRALAVLSALLSFHQETVLTGPDLIVYPSNRQLGVRANGMAPGAFERRSTGAAGADRPGQPRTAGSLPSPGEDARRLAVPSADA